MIPSASFRIQVAEVRFSPGLAVGLGVHKLPCQEPGEERIHKMQQENAELAVGILSDADISNKFDGMMGALLEE